MFIATPSLSIAYRQPHGLPSFILTDDNGRDFRVSNFTVFENGNVRAEGPGFRADGSGMTLIHRHVGGDIDLLPTDISRHVRDDFAKYGVFFPFRAF